CGHRTLFKRRREYTYTHTRTRDELISIGLTSEEDFLNYEGTDYTVIWQILQCMNCLRPVFKEIYSDIHLSPHETILYPPESEILFSLPENIRQIYLEILNMKN